MGAWVVGRADINVVEVPDREIASVLAGTPRLAHGDGAGGFVVLDHPQTYVASEVAGDGIELLVFVEVDGYVDELGIFDRGTAVRPYDFDFGNDAARCWRGYEGGGARSWLWECLQTRETVSFQSLANLAIQIARMLDEQENERD